MNRWKLACSIGAVAAVSAACAFFWIGEHREVEARARRIASDKAIFATADQRATTYAAIKRAAAACWSQPLPDVRGEDPIWKEKTASHHIDMQVCEYQTLYGNNYDSLLARWRAIEWLELPFDIVVAFLFGLAATYMSFAAVYLVREKWWGWVQK